MATPRVWIGGWRHVEHLDPTKSHTGKIRSWIFLCLTVLVLVSTFIVPTILLAVAWRTGPNHIKASLPKLSKPNYCLHIIYQVEIATASGRYTRVERRYSAFLALHKECRKFYTTPSFPPKRIRNTTARVLESRRAGLEYYIQGLAKIQPTPPQLSAFLQLPTIGERETIGEHGAILGYKNDPYLDYDPTLKPDDMITQGMSDLAWLDTSLMLPYAALQVLAPGLPDKFGARKVMFICLTLASCTTFLSSLSPNYTCLSITLALTGLFLAPVWPACSKMLTSWFPDSKLNSVFGLINTATYTGGRNILICLGGTALAATIVQFYTGDQKGIGWRKAFAYPSIIALVAGCLLFTLKSPQERQIEISGKKEKKDTGHKSHLPNLLRTPGVKELCMTMFCLKFVRFMIYFWLPLYLKKVLGYTNLQSGFLSTMFDIGGIIGSPLLGFGLDIFFPGKPLKGVTYCMLVGTLSVGCFIISASGGLYVNCISLLIMGATNCGPDSLLGGSISMEVGNRKADGNGASVTSLVNGVGSLGGVLEGSAVWMVWYLSGWTGVLNLVLGLTALGTFACARTYSAIKKSDRAEKLNQTLSNC